MLAMAAIKCHKIVVSCNLGPYKTVMQTQIDFGVEKAAVFINNLQLMTLSKASGLD